MPVKLWHLWAMRMDITCNFSLLTQYYIIFWGLTTERGMPALLVYTKIGGMARKTVTNIFKILHSSPPPEGDSFNHHFIQMIISVSLNDIHFLLLFNLSILGCSLQTPQKYSLKVHQKNLLMKQSLSLHLQQ